jgi:hypothetical protein
MSSLTHAPVPTECVERLRRVLGSVDLECACRMTLNGVLERFSDLERRRRLRSALSEARRQRKWIAGQLDFLAELDELTENESDVSVFEEVAALFDEIGIAARSAAQTIRETSAASDF